ncbi:MAG TPA: CpsD/CapB family tyrosine-protein kinase [Blastocatellia bacterium]|nr:CpsD/CapB family tyrosine-protein kinase [Blastocatellia bacterium]
MGKVYEALLRAESEDAVRGLDDDTDDIEAIDVEDERAIRNPHGIERATLGDDAGFELDTEAEIAPGFAIEAEGNFDRGFNRGSERDRDRRLARGGQPSRFSFLRYSLGDGSVFDQGPRQASASALTRRSIAQPAREMTVDLGRIDPHLSVLLGNDRGSSEQFNKLALTLISRAAERGFKRVLVASANHGEGRTTVTLNLACALARARQRVLVVDCDLMRPAALARLGLAADIGMVEAFRSQLPAGAATLRVQPFGFNLLPCRQRVDNPVELLAAPGFWKMLQLFDADHDFILFDSSPLLEMGDATLLAKFTDTTLMVVQSGALTSAEMARAIAPFTPEDLLGVVLNRLK